MPTIAESCIPPEMLAEDYNDIVDNLESGTILVYNTDDENSPVIDSKRIEECALRRMVQDEMDFERRVQAPDIHIVAGAEKLFWHIPFDAMGAMVPIKGMSFVDDRKNETWIILNVEKLTSLTRYKLACIKR
jgi:hypothetical protein